MRTHRAALVLAISLLLSLAASVPSFGAETGKVGLAAQGSATSFVLTGFRFSGNDSIDSATLAALVDYAVGERLDIDGLNALADVITKYYREQGYWFARAYLPEQEITDGVLLIAVIEGKYGRVEVNRLARLPEALPLSYLRDIRPGSTIQGPPLERSILLLSDLPGVEATASLNPGTETGTADLRVSLHPAERFRAGLTLTNDGKEWGAFRSIVNARWSNPLGHADEFAVSLMGASSGTRYARLAYEAPVNDSATRLNMAYAVSTYALDDEFAVLEASGETRRVSFIASHPVDRGPRSSVVGEAGFVYTNVQETMVGLAESERALSGLSAAVRGEWIGEYGDSLSAALDVRVGSVWFASATDAAFDAAGPKTAGEFRKASADVSMFRPFGAYTSAKFSFSGQWASKNLDPTEKLVLGGPEGVRAYSTDEPSVDVGWVGRFELRRDVAHRLLPGVREATLFVDVGGGRVNKAPWPGAGEADRLTLAGGGVGLVWQYNSFTAEVNYAVPIPVGDDAPDGGARLLWQATMRF